MLHKGKYRFKVLEISNPAYFIVQKYDNNINNNLIKLRAKNKNKPISKKNFHYFQYV